MWFIRINLLEVFMWFIINSKNKRIQDELTGLILDI